MLLRARQRQSEPAGLFLLPVLWHYHSAVETEFCAAIMTRTKRELAKRERPMARTKPVITIIDWRTAPVSDPASIVERGVIKEDAEIRYHRMLGDTEFTQDILETDALILWHNIPVSEACIKRLKRCRVIVRNGVGYDTVDVNAAARHGIPVCNVPDYGTEEVADHAITLALALVRQIFPLDVIAKQCGWTIPDMDKIRRLRELTFGIVGLGRIGIATALRAKALGFKVLFYDPYVSNGAHKAIGIERARTLGSLLTDADVLSLHCPLTEETFHLIGPKQLALMKPTAYVVNTARGAVIQKTAILEALKHGKIAGAGLDVIEDEPLRSPNEANVPNLVATCHAAFCSRESRLEMRSTSARIALAAIKGLPLENIVNGVH
jgi:phosphoglycerate dehydrogenase-like enzyme